MCSMLLGKVNSAWTLASGHSVVSKGYHKAQTTSCLKLLAFSFLIHNVLMLNVIHICYPYILFMKYILCPMFVCFTKEEKADYWYFILAGYENFLSFWDIVHLYLGFHVARILLIVFFPILWSYSFPSGSLFLI